jgi:hypothetical protein
MSNRQIEAQTQARVIELRKQPQWHDPVPTFGSEQAPRYVIELSKRRT